MALFKQGISRHCEGLRPWQSGKETLDCLAAARNDGTAGDFAAALFHSSCTRVLFWSEQLCVKHNQRYSLTEPFQFIIVFSGKNSIKLPRLTAQELRSP